jgi:hypothetical protein
MKAHHEDRARWGLEMESPIDSERRIDATLASLAVSR